MASRKQRRRREKEKRHDYEIVYLDDEGNEVEPDEPDVRAPAKRGESKGSSSKASTTSGRRGRAPQPPSWRRVAKRGAIFAPLFIATVLLLGGKRMTLAGAVFQAVVLLALFVPFSYFLDSLMYRSHQKKLGRGPAAKR